MNYRNATQNEDPISVVTYSVPCFKKSLEYRDFEDNILIVPDEGLVGPGGQAPVLDLHPGPLPGHQQDR